MDVLIVDDDEVMGELLVTLMSLDGYRASHAGSAEEALGRVRQAEAAHDVILCDIQMPEMRGGELARALAEARREGRLRREALLVGMSGSAPDGEEARHFDGFLQKPFTVEEFAEAVEQIRALGAGSGRDVSATARDEMEARDGEGPPPLSEKTFSLLRSKLGDGSLRELYEMTLDDVEERLRRIAAAAKAGDAATVKREAHTIKGSCGMVGAMELQELAAATEGGSAVDTPALEKFDRACKRLRGMLEETL